MLDFFKEASSTVREHAKLTIETSYIIAASSPEETLQTIDYSLKTLIEHQNGIQDLQEFVSTNMAAVRDLLSQYHVQVEPFTPLPDFLSDDAEHEPTANSKTSNSLVCKGSFS